MLDPRLVEAIHNRRIQLYFKTQYSLAQKLAAELQQNPTALEAFAIGISKRLFPILSDPLMSRRSACSIFVDEQLLTFAIMQSIIKIAKQKSCR